MDERGSRSSTSTGLVLRSAQSSSFNPFSRAPRVSLLVTFNQWMGPRAFPLVATDAKPTVRIALDSRIATLWQVWEIYCRCAPFSDASGTTEI